MKTPDQDINWEDRALKAEADNERLIVIAEDRWPTVYAKWSRSCQVAEDHRVRANVAEDERDALQSKLSALVAAARPFVRHWEPWMDEYDAYEQVSVFSRHTFGELRRLRALALALSEVEQGNQELTSSVARVDMTAQEPHRPANNLSGKED